MVKDEEEATPPAKPYDFDQEESGEIYTYPNQAEKIGNPSDPLQSPDQTQDP